MEPFALIGSQGVEWTDPDGHRWLLVFHFAEIDGAAEVVGMDFRTFRERGSARESVDPDGPHPLTASILRAVPFGAQAQAARRWALDLRRDERFLAEWLTSAGLGHDEQAEAIATAGRHADALEEPEAKTRRTRWTRGPLREAAQVYVEALTAGAPPTQAVADHFDLSHSMAAKVVRRARDADLLPETTQGKALGRARNPRRDE